MSGLVDPEIDSSPALNYGRNPFGGSSATLLARMKKKKERKIVIDEHKEQDRRLELTRCGIIWIAFWQLSVFQRLANTCKLTRAKKKEKREKWKSIICQLHFPARSISISKWKRLLYNHFFLYPQARVGGLHSERTLILTHYSQG